MKKLVFLFILAALTSCSKEDDITKAIGSGELTMKINGTLWTGSVLNNFVDETTQQAAISTLNVASNETMGIVLDDFTGIGTYPKSGSNGTGAIYVRKDKVLFTSGREITYKVTSVDGAVGSRKPHGTFEGTIKSGSGEVLTITEGKF